MAVAILRNGHEGAAFGFIVGFCSDRNLGEAPFPGDPTFDSVTFPNTEAGAGTPCVKFQSLVAAARCFVSINGLTAGDSLCLPDASGGTTCTPMEQVGGVAVRFNSASPDFDVLVAVAMDTSLCNGNGYWTRGLNNAQISMPGNVLMYHELVGHALHHCIGDFNAGDPEGQAITEENVLRAAQGIDTRTTHEGGCGGGSNGCFIASAAYGSASAPEVQVLRDIRDRVLRSTDWGEAVFDEIYRYYYAISPAIADRIKQDEHLRVIVRAALVEPWSIALNTFLRLPSNPEDPAEAVAFAKETSGAFGDWIDHLPMAEFRPVDDVAAGDMLTILSIFPNPQVRRAVIRNLNRSGFLPLERADDLKDAIRALGLPAVDEALILGPEHLA